MAYSYLNVIDEDFDVQIDMSVILDLQTKYNKIKPKDQIYDKIYKHSYDLTKPVDFNYRRIEKLSRKLSKRLQLSTNQIEGSKLFNFPVPAYCPPSSKDILMFDLQVLNYRNSFQPFPISNNRIPKMPQIPRAKTNTNLANYIHKLYIYQLYIKEQLKIHELKKSSHYLTLNSNRSSLVSNGLTDGSTGGSNSGSTGGSVSAIGGGSGGSKKN